MSYTAYVISLPMEYRVAEVAADIDIKRDPDSYKKLSVTLGHLVWALVQENAK